MPIIKLKDVELYYDEFGSGDRYLIQAQQYTNNKLHYTIDLAKQGFHVFNIQIRGYAPSTPVHEDLGEAWYDVWAQDVCDFADFMGIQSFFYTGYSHGAGIGWHLCMNHPERLRAFFPIVGGPHKRDGQETGSARMNTIMAAESRETWRPYAEKMTAGNTEMFRRIAERADDEETKHLAWAAAEQYRNFWINMPKEAAILNPRKPFPKVKTEEALIEILGNIEIPTLMIGGMMDDISTPEDMVRSCKAVKHSKLVLYSDANHGNLGPEFRLEIVEDIMQFCNQRHLI
ncbi:alpha/beta fold hydrolase [Paenibacillus sp. FSL W8-0186]|uniref:alpha/beta fold hydrolase n=1 Tax=Paenibacillus TaxID=44249 RepID=UPI0030D07138